MYIITNQKRGKMAKPFIKWAGGKSQLLSEIRKHYPNTVERYCEPFLGGGAVLFDVLQMFNPAEVLVNDINKELVNTYSQIKTNCDALLEQLKKYQDAYWSSTLEENKKSYFEKRERFNSLKVNGSEKDCVEKAALFIFLNKTCFNGLYRVNSKGLFNVPFNSVKKPLLCDTDNLTECSKLLQNVEITCGDYSQTRSFIDDKTFVYFDPPYRPLSTTSSFTAYSEKDFADKEQIALQKYVDELTQKGAKVVLSNSDPKNSDADDDFFDELYSDYDIERIEAKRMINSKASNRGAVRELLICNYHGI